MVSQRFNFLEGLQLNISSTSQGNKKGEPSLEQGDIPVESE